MDPWDLQNMCQGYSYFYPQSPKIEFDSSRKNVSDVKYNFNRSKWSSFRADKFLGRGLLPLLQHHLDIQGHPVALAEDNGVDIQLAEAVPQVMGKL